ncbi:AAA family ATPase [Flavobacterium sp. I3-2]|uniref:AAA family ATPase n=1 Tax=Flavobacterium sp. I3-2 TaxID=2748319 RepID=UPI0015A8A3D6|nr:AAA family ATPase [Flavobacterium sp. I3-2]
MMNTQQLLDQSRKLFNGFSEVDSNLYKGNLSIDDKIAGIYYLNFNQEISEEEFDQLQYKYLAEEFYNQDEALQWNIYLLFINSNISDSLKIRILKDDKYARKLIFSDKEFLDYFELEKSEKSELPDIVATWKDELNKVGLQEIYSQASYDGIVRNFLNNTIPNIVEKKDKNLDDVPVIENISSISLKDTYRPYPKLRDFNFGSVNLFTGSNGVGKTSLLESIELILTGRTQRNQDKTEDSNSISAILNENLNETYTHNNRLYKERGSKWYNRRISEQGNQTFKSFNQFNFFNTDAAHQFSNSEERDVINDSLKQIILGEEYTTLKDKIQKIQTRLKPELNKTSRSIKEKNEEFKKNSDRINELRSNNSFEEVKDNIKFNISNLNYRTSIEESKFSVTNLFINEIKNEIDFILPNKWLTNYKKFLSVKENILTRNKLVAEAKESYYENIQNSNKSIQNRLQIDDVLSKANNFLKYSEIEDNFRIELLEINSKKNDTQLSIIKKLIDLNNLQLDILKLAEDYKTLPEAISSKELILSTKASSLKDLKNDVHVLQENLSQNEKLINELKQLGKKILNQNSHSNSCPLCEQQISHSNLLQKLESEFRNDTVKKAINDKNVLIDTLALEVAFLEKELSDLKHYDVVVSNYLSTNEVISLDQIDKNIQDTINKEKEILIEKESYDRLFFRLGTISGSISEYSKLKSELLSKFPNQDICNEQILRKIIVELKNQLATYTTDIENLKFTNNKIISELNSSLKLKEYTDRFDKIEEIVNSNNTKIESLNFSFENLNRYIQIPEDRNIVEISKDLALLNENLNTLRIIENSQNEIKKLLIVNEDIEKSLPQIKELSRRLNIAVELLEKLNNNSEDIILEDFFKNNLNEIKDIFKTIHSPQEFSTLQYKDNKLILFKEDKAFEISQISTGQRAALVLSIFISLNRKLQNGPNILIFDDPVTFIDDFNALSFLDFLRYFIVKEKKQIFFATANKKFSNLFRKKFEFLGQNEFREFQLER